MEASLAALIGRNIRRARGEMPNKPNTRQFGEILKDLDPRRAPNHQRVSDWERGVQKPSDDYMQLIVQATGKPLDWFYREHEEEGPTPDPFASDENGNGDDDLLARLAALEEAVSELDEQVRLWRAEGQTRDVEARKRTAEGFQTILDLLRRRPA